MRFVFSPLTLALLAAGAHAQHTTDITPTENKDPAVERIVVTSEHMLEPGQVVTDPKQPRQPLPASDGADYLKTIAGFNLIRKGGVSGDPVFRSMSASRLTIVNDGTMLLGGCNSRMDPPTAYINPHNYDVIRVIKGPQSVLNLPATATVQFERQEQPMQQAGIEGDVSLVIASFARRELSTDLQGGNQQGYVRFTGSYAESDNYRDGKGNVVNSHYQRQGGSAELAWTPTENSVLAITLAQSAGEAAYADRSMDGSEFDRSQWGVRLRQDDITPWLSRLEVNWYQSDIDHVMDNYSLRTFTPSMMLPNPAAMNPTRTTDGGRLQATLTPADGWQLRLGADTNDNVHTNRMSMNQLMMPHQDKPHLSDGEFSQWGVFIESDYQLNPARSWHLGIRRDDWQAIDQRSMLMKTMTVSVMNPTFADVREDILTSGFIRFEQQFADSAMYAGWGRAARFPDYWELLGKARGSQTSPSAFNIAPEITHQWDMGWLGKTDSLQWDVSLFYANYQDYVLLDQQSMMGPETVRNIAAHTYGGEASLSWQIDQAWRVQSALSVSRGMNDTDRRDLAQQAPAELRIDLGYTSGQWQWGGVWRLVRAQRHIAKGQGTIVGLDTTPTAGFGVVSVNASRTVASNWRLSLGIDNLLNKSYQEALSRSASLIPGFVSEDKVNEPGRTLWLKLDYSI
ncbi:TonB-dependent copper receptor [Bowmanella sp. JS7-9]|uniref:TonB-dependent copper receptor n=1 Tax=Alteromonadaceae TaxID=72275 RepID=UPI00103FDECB|nr:TonB-dependent copper receptor [Bowmanella sp. JS7-9]TBX22042.1 TonB-dependent receptor [Bowmanella sp. JS7-9]